MTTPPARLAVTVCPLCAAVVAYGPGVAHHLAAHVKWAQCLADEVEGFAVAMDDAVWLLTR